MKLKLITGFFTRLLVTTTAVLLVVTAYALPEVQFESAYAQFIQAIQGDERATEKSAGDFAALLKSEPNNPLLMAYTGAATAMKATTTWLPWKKMGYAEDGMALLDKALARLTPLHDVPGPRKVPVTLEVRFVAANTFLAVPGFMNRGARGGKLLGEVLASPLFAAAPLMFKGDVWLAGAKLATKEKRNDDARKYLGEVIKLNAPQAEAARLQLKVLAS